MAMIVMNVLVAYDWNVDKQNKCAVALKLEQRMNERSSRKITGQNAEEQYSSKEFDVKVEMGC